MQDEHDEGTQPEPQEPQAEEPQAEEPQAEEPQSQDAPDDDAGPAVEPADTTPSQGEQVPQDPSSGPHPTSAPPAEAQSGVPPLPENEGVEPGDGDDE